MSVSHPHSVRAACAWRTSKLCPVLLFSFAHIAHGMYLILSIKNTRLFRVFSVCRSLSPLVSSLSPDEQAHQSVGYCMHWRQPHHFTWCRRSGSPCWQPSSARFSTMSSTNLQSSWPLKIPNSPKTTINVLSSLLLRFSAV